MFPIQFGFCVPIFAMPGPGLFRTPNYAALDAAVTMELARSADALGYDSLWVADHLMLGKDEAILEGWTVLAALAGSTQRAKLGMIHQAHFFRHPAIAAKMIATLDQISGGRFIYFIDGGTRGPEHHAYGVQWPLAFEERMEHMIEGLQLTLALWKAENPISFRGKHYHVADAVCTPLPIQRPHPPIWLGEPLPLTLEMAARYAQCWNSVPVGVPELRRRLDALAAACAQADRPYDELEKSLEIQILVAPDHAALRQRLREMLTLAAAPPADAALQAFVDGSSDDLPSALKETWLIGTPDEVQAQISMYIDMGITHFMLWFVDVPRGDGLRLFAEQVAPAFKTSAS